MCNPRRIEVTVIRQVQEAWEREVRRVAAVTGSLTGEARIVQRLDNSLGPPAMEALRARFTAGEPGWTDDGEGGFRHDVDGGYIVFVPEDDTLEIVATLSEDLRVMGSASTTLSGTFDGTVEARAKGNYYDDGWGGRTRERAEAEANAASQTEFDRNLRRTVTEAAEAAEREGDAALRAQAEAAAREEWAQAAASRRAELSRQAESQLGLVGLRARQAFNRVLAASYRDALVALARRRGVRPEDIVQTETDDTIDIEFMLPN